MIRYRFGLTGSCLTTGAVGSDAAISDLVAIQQMLASYKPNLDIDGDGKIDALTDGLLIVRYLFGLRGPALIDNAIGTGATRSAAEIEAYISTLVPSP